MGMGDTLRPPQAQCRWGKPSWEEAVKTILAADGSVERSVVYRPDNEGQRVRTWTLQLFANLISCPYCGASPCRPCRTFTGRIPGRISDTHRDRLRLAGGWLNDGGPPPTVSAPQEIAALSGVDLYPPVGFWPYDDSGEHRAWLECWIAGFVDCSTCGAGPAQPCRTNTGSAPGRTTGLHGPRTRRVWEMGLPADVEPHFVWDLLQGAGSAPPGTGLTTR
jgi:hypothetical protein